MRDTNFSLHTFFFSWGGGNDAPRKLEMLTTAGFGYMGQIRNPFLKQIKFEHHAKQIDIPRLPKIKAKPC